MAGKLLTDSEILEAFKNGNIKCPELNFNNVQLGDKSCPIQPSSLDLHIGEIFVPPAKKFDMTPKWPWQKVPQNKPPARKGTSLAPGHSAIIVTKETIELSKRVSAFGFPPAHLSSSALLMTNPGHVDPGYKGKLSFTVINLGREDIQLDVDTIIVTLLIFMFEEEVSFGYGDLKSNIPTPKTTDDERMSSKLNALSPDFGNYSSRMASEALRAVEVHSVRLGWAQLIVPALAGAATAAFIWFSSLFPNISAVASDKEVETKIATVTTALTKTTAGLEQQLSDLSQRLKQLETGTNILDFDEQLDALRDEIKRIQNDG
jgi:deoxycytidine triphosphate deaminase